MEFNITFQQTKMFVESIKREHEIDSLRTIVLNLTDKCQLKCNYCPHSKGYNYDNYMTIDVVNKLYKMLKDINYKGMISISGNGEPTLHPLINQISSRLSEFNLQILSNGLTDVDYVYLSKYARLIISIHNFSDIEYLTKKFDNIPNSVIRNHIINSPGNELIVTNRAGYMNDKHCLNDYCTYPFYKMFIDYDGSYLLCADDWKRNTKIAGVDIYHLSIEDYFCKYLKDIKGKMKKKLRQKIFPCQICSTNGTMIGKCFLNDSR